MNEHDLCSSHEEMAKQIKEIHSALLGTLDKPGWLNRVARLEVQAKAISRGLVGLLSAAALGMGAYVWGLIVHVK
jgi:hypothetical protein